MEKIVSVTETHVYTERDVFRSGKIVKKIGKYQKYLCIGGQYTGQLKAKPQLENDSYYPFNAGTRYFGNVTLPKRIFVHAGILLK